MGWEVKVLNGGRAAGGGGRVKRKGKGGAVSAGRAWGRGGAGWS